MSDQEESLISQDDIDKLLDASSIEEAEILLDSEENGDDVDVDDELGELSQDHIDSLLGGGGFDSQELEDDAPEESGELSQDDIDRLMGGDTPDDSEDDTDENAQEEFSQDDIDSLLGNGSESDSGDEKDIELVSQEDIDRLMTPDQEQQDPGVDFGQDLDAEADDELISMADIQGILDEESQGDDTAESPIDAQPLTEAEPETGYETDAVEVTATDETAETQDDSLDVVIAEADMTSVEDCLITQDTMDDLIQGAASPAEVQTPESPAPSEDMTVLLDTPEGQSGEDDGDLPGQRDSLESDDFGLDWGDEGGDDVSQDDIDALLSESDDDDDFLDDDILISQDDIDTLLMAADQEDEDVFDDFMDEDTEFDMGGDIDMDDLMGDDGADDFSADADQVVLEGGNEQSETESGKKASKLKKIGGIFKSKLVLAALSLVLVLMISVPAAYFFFFSGEEETLVPKQEKMPLAEADLGREIDVTMVSIGEPDLMVDRKPGTLVLADFVILASDTSKEMTYIYADISIDYSDQRAYHEINANLSFYRDLIYGSIRTSLMSEKKDEVTEADLLWGVETSLKRVLPPNYIKKISFKTFITT